MTGSSALGLAALLAMQQAPPPDAVPVLAALDAGNAAAIQGLLSEDAVIVENPAGAGQESPPAAVTRFLQGCRRSDLTWDRDQETRRIVLTIHWSCPGRGTAEMFVWLRDRRVEWIQFGRIISSSEPHS